MIIRKTQVLPNGIELSIIELDNPIIVQNFEKRFQLLLRVNNKNIFPKSKFKFFEFEKNDHLYTLISEKTGEKIVVNQVLYFKKQICDKSYDECTNTISSIVSHYNSGQDIIVELRKEYNF